MSATLIVLAKQPRPGRVKTRLCPPCSPAEAARLAQAALADTLAAVAAVSAPRRLLALEGEAGPWVPRGFDVVAQPAGGLGRRLAAAFDAAGGGPAVLVGMDTPQLTPELLAGVRSEVEAPGVDAVLGAAPDGGYWAIGLRRPDPRVFEGVPMSSAETLAAQRGRLRELGLRTTELCELRDVDTIADARAVASAWPGTRFARVLAELGPGVRGLAGAPA